MPTEIAICTGTRQWQSRLRGHGHPGSGVEVRGMSHGREQRQPVAPTAQEHRHQRVAVVGGGGRDIRLCLECGRARSWRSGAGLEERVEDPDFDLVTFLR